MALLTLEGFVSSVLHALITNDQPENFEEVAMDWLIALIVIAVAWSLLAFIIKWLMKFFAKLPQHKIWGRTRTVVYILGGVVLLGATVGLVWKSSVDFVYVVGVPGLFKGMFVGGIFYVMLMLLYHLFGDARHDLYY